MEVSIIRNNERIYQYEKTNKLTNEVYNDLVSYKEPKQVTNIKAGCNILAISTIGATITSYIVSPQAIPALRDIAGILTRIF